MKIGYVRVSTVDQNEARQVEALKKYGIEKWYSEKVKNRYNTLIVPYQILIIPCINTL